MKIYLIVIFLGISFAFSNNINYSIPLQKEKALQIKNAVNLYQYIYDLKKLKEILELLINNNSFKEISKSAELNFKNTNSLYSVGYIKHLLEVLKGKNCNKGYIQDMKDKFNLKYEIYINNYPYKQLINKNFDVIKNRIQNSLIKLDQNFKKENNLKPYLNTIFSNLIMALEEIKNETLKLKDKNIIIPFTKKEDNKYCMPKNWAQTDGKTTLIDIINFILNGDKKYHLYGIKDYYNLFYQKSNPFIIIK